ncbi:hypothetical protein F5J12DRAFT_786719 [Pisolithus orientalis]|uniref:uncharacterized protein n=1 Tax=Pisolithus orientalis TaxID=936130 RepID=UPI0022259A1D|nr:uncharacterized protein F5J12DRAFT_786719 [Pisolithus orientalis]KAI5989212.1 hypothetical protein F5J12DRAFT_786719 [Pisolithus orientalis]
MLGLDISVEATFNLAIVYTRKATFLRLYQHAIEAIASKWFYAENETLEDKAAGGSSKSLEYAQRISFQEYAILIDALSKHIKPTGGVTPKKIKARVEMACERERSPRSIWLLSKEQRDMLDVGLFVSRLRERLTGNRVKSMEDAADLDQVAHEFCDDCRVLGKPSADGNPEAVVQFNFRLLVTGTWTSCTDPRKIWNSLRFGSNLDLDGPHAVELLTHLVAAPE